MGIYIVMGSAGEYDDQSEWAVIAYQDEALAQQHMLAAQKEASRIQREIQELSRGYEDWEETRARENALLVSNIYDPQMQIAHPGASYYLCEVDLAVALPTPATPPDTPHS